MTYFIGVEKCAAVVPVEQLPVCPACDGSGETMWQYKYGVQADQCGTCSSVGHVPPESLIGETAHLIRPKLMQPNGPSYTDARRVGVGTIAAIERVVGVLPGFRQYTEVERSDRMSLRDVYAELMTKEASHVQLKKGDLALVLSDVTECDDDWLPCSEHDEHRDVGGYVCQRCERTGALPLPDVKLHEMRVGA